MPRRPRSPSPGQVLLHRSGCLVTSRDAFCRRTEHSEGGGRWNAGTVTARRPVMPPPMDRCLERSVRSVRLRPPRSRWIEESSDEAWIRAPHIGPIANRRQHPQGPLRKPRRSTTPRCGRTSACWCRLKPKPPTRVRRRCSEPGIRTVFEHMTALTTPPRSPPDPPGHQRHQHPLLQTGDARARAVATMDS